MTETWKQKNTLSLKDLQKRFVASLALNQTDPLLFRNMDSKVDPIHKRFNIYRQNRDTTFSKVLQEMYPVCHQILGETCFLMLAKKFFHKNVSTFFSLHHWGQGFSDFILPYSEQWSLPYLPDLVRLEYYIHLVSWGSDPENKDTYGLFKTLHELPENRYRNIQLILGKNKKLLRSSYPIDRIWDVHQHNFQDPAIPELNISETQVKLLVYRKEYDICIARLSQVEWDILQVIEQGASLEMLYEACVQGRLGSQAMNVIETLTVCVKNGWIDLI